MKLVYIKKFPKYLMLLALIGFASACSEDFLETEPSTAIPTEDVFESIRTAEAALIGAYDAMSSWSGEGLYNPMMGDLIGEDVMVNAVDNWNWFVPVYQMNVLASYNYASNPWSTGYKVIFDANNIIEKAQSIPDATDEEMDNLEGQAKVLRAFSMLKLAEMFAPAYMSNPDALSIMNVNRVLDVNEDPLPRATNREIYEQIINDLTVAIELLQENADKGFFDKKSAQALLARTYLDMGEYEKARDMAKASYEGLELMTIGDMFSGFNYRNSETIFTIAYVPDDNNIYLSIPSFYYPVFGYSSIRANDEFLKIFEYGDARAELMITDSDIDENRSLILKFAHYQSVGNAERIAIRASEMYLIEAECEAELGNYSNAQDAMHKVKQRSMPGVVKTTKTGQDLIDEILLERRKELFGEGFRWNDIKRRQLPFVRTGDHWVKFDFTAADTDYYRLTLPIPQGEIDANDNISQSDQNIGY